jgi:hypothetical protein
VEEQNVTHGTFALERSTKFSFGLMQRLFDALMPCVGNLPVGGDVEQVATLLTRIGGDHQLNKRREIPSTFGIRDRMLRQAGVVMRAEPHSP